MANRQFDFSVTDLDINSIAGSDTGTVTNDVRVVVVEGAERDKVVYALKALADLIAADQETIN